MDVVSCMYCVRGMVRRWAEKELDEERVMLKSFGRLLTILDRDDL